jgi:hypothetical protein
MPKITNAILNTEGKVDHYVCTDCDCKYYSRFQDTTLCFTCLKPLQYQIAKKLNTTIRFK